MRFACHPAEEVILSITPCDVLLTNSFIPSKYREVNRMLEIKIDDELRELLDQIVILAVKDFFSGYEDIDVTPL